MNGAAAAGNSTSRGHLTDVPSSERRVLSEGCHCSSRPSRSGTLIDAISLPASLIKRTPFENWRHVSCVLQRIGDTFVCKSMSVCVSVSVHICAYVFVCLFIYLPLPMSASVSVCVCVSALSVDHWIFAPIPFLFSIPLFPPLLAMTTWETTAVKWYKLLLSLPLARSNFSSC